MRKQLSFIETIGFCFVLVSSLLIASLSHAAPVSEGRPIVIGAPLSVGFNYGLGSKQSIILAAEEINAKGGIIVSGKRHPLKVEVADTRDLEPGVPTSEGLMVVEKLLLQQKADFLVGGPIRSEVMLATMDLVSRYKKPSILSVGAVTPTFNKRISDDPNKFKYSFRTSGNSINLTTEGLGVTEQLKKQHGFDKVYIMGQDVAWARASSSLYKSELEKRGFTICGYELYPTGSTDYSMGLLKAKESGAKIIFPWMDMPETSILINQWYDMKVRALLIGYMVAATHPDYWNGTKGTCEYIADLYTKAGTVPTPALPKSVEFVNSYKKRWGKEPISEYDGSCYTAVYVLVDAIGRAGTLDSDSVAAALEKTDIKGTVMGRVRFDKTHDVIYSQDPKEGAVSLWAQWIKGKRVVVYPSEIASGRIELPPWMK